MTTLALTGLVSGAGLCVSLGYGARVLVERWRVRWRERVLLALGGALPDWETRARELETKAHEEGAYRGNIYKAYELRKEADVTRVRGRRRDREWA